MFREAARGPFEQIVAGGAAREPLPAERLEVGQHSNVDIVVGDIETIGWTNRGAQWLDRVREPRVAAVEFSPRVPHVERRGCPSQRSEERRKLIVVDAGDRAGERAVQVVAAFEQVEDTREVAIAGYAPRFVAEEDFTHTREAHPRLHLIGLLRPVPEVDVA